MSTRVAHHQLAPHLHGPFGGDRFGRRAEQFARFFGTPRFLIAQSALVAVWIAINIVLVTYRWDPYPFILLNLAFSLQAAYAAPLILLAQTRQADRDKAQADVDAAHRESLAFSQSHRLTLLEGRLDRMTELLEEIHRRGATS